MHRISFSLAVVLCLVLASARITQAQSSRVDPDAVQTGIDNAVKYLLSRQQEDGSWPDSPAGGLEIEDNDRIIAMSSLATYALLASGQRVHSEPMEKAIEYLSRQRTAWTYAVSLRCQVWLEAHKQDERDSKFLRALRNDSRLIWRAGMRHRTRGAYSYRVDHDHVRGYAQDRFDLSNAQYALLGAWAAYQANIEIPRRYWEQSERFWRLTQKDDGGWWYKPAQTQTLGSMTAAGLASTFVCVDASSGAEFVNCTGRYNQTIVKGLAWFDKNFAETMRNRGLAIHLGQLPYYLFGVERVALASGYKYFGGLDWYQAGAKWILDHQNKNTGQMANDHDTAYALLFLIRGQRPVLINHLIHPEDWNNRPRALAVLTRWMSKALEKQLNWQIIDPATDVAEWHDAPLLLLSGSKAFQLSDAQIQSLRTYALQGGTILTIPECRGDAFTKSVEELYDKLFPRYKLTAIDANDPIYSLNTKNLGGRPRARWVHNGVRPLAIHVDKDLTRSWQMREYATNPGHFGFLSNLAILVTDWHLRNRGTNYWPAAPTGANRSVSVARLDYGANADPEPLALERFSRLMGNREKVQVKVLPPVKPAGLADSGAKVAFVTGAGKLTLSDADQAALVSFVKGGGTVLVDAAAGSQEFASSARTVLRETFKVDRMTPVPGRSKVFVQDGHAIEKVTWSRAATLRSRSDAPRLRGVKVNGRWGLLFSDDDLTLALLGRSVHGNEGYSPESAYEIVRNIILNAMSE